MYDYMRALHARSCREPELQKARTHSHSYQKIKKGLPAAILFLCIAYQFLTWGCPALALSMTCFSSSSSKQ